MAKEIIKNLSEVDGNMTNLKEFARYGVKLVALAQDDIEMVRQWRNDPKIANLMLDKTYITSEMQQCWFDRLQHATDQFYYLVWFKNQPIGVTSLIKVNRDAGCCEPGMYIYVDEYRNNIVPFCVAFALNDLAFEELGVSQLFGKIFANNQPSVRFHEACGYRHYETQEDGLGLYVLEPEPYLAARAHIARFIRY
ncbi:GNAT family N-acetyltransferase [Aeromonas veronii]|uniref:GNAT family N-acetyltransferase n=1 Tax=Aeromonas veronii TaxID=654 RepID=UPI003B9ECC84